MKKLLFALTLFATLTGCANIKSAYETVTSAKVSAKTVYVAVNAFDAAKVTAKNYIIYCTPNPAPVGCDDKAIQTKLNPAILAGTRARNTLEDFQAAHPGELGDKGIYDALITATDTIKDVTASFKG